MFNRPLNAFRLRAPVGNGRQNDPDDVVAVQRQLAQRGYYGQETDEPSGFIDRTLINGIRRYQDDNGLVVDGWLAPGGETERNLKLPRGGTHTVFNPDASPSGIELSDEIGNGRVNREEDVTGVKQALGALGLYRYDRTADPSPFIDRAMLDGIKAFQAGNGLNVDGLMQPGGETVTAMNVALGGAPRQDNSAKPANGMRNLLAVNDESEDKALPIAAAQTGHDEDKKPLQMAQSLTDLPLHAAGAVAVGAVIAEQARKAAQSLSAPPKAPDAPPPLSLQDRKDFENGLRGYLNEATGAEGEKDDDAGGRRGKKATRDTNDIIVEEYNKLLADEFSHLKEKVWHTGGATIEGKGETPVPEKYMQDPSAPPDNKTLGSGYGDVTYDDYPINSTDVRKTDGLPVARERRGLEKLGRLVGQEAIPWVKKLLKDYGPDDVDEVREQARKACRITFERLEKKYGVRSGSDPKEQEEGG